jgi:membrane associated rhomboid family serine protease
MIPLKDTVRAREFPAVTAALIGANVLVFLLEISLPPEAQETFLWLLGVVPARFLAYPLPTEWLTLFTSQFLHGGWLHIGSNMLALYIFGDNVEDRLGHARYLMFYLLCGVAAAFAHIWSGPDSPVPSLGASGAISGVLAAYLVLFPTARVMGLMPIFFIPWFVEIPAAIWVVGWFLAQLLNGVLTISAGVDTFGGVAYWAHVGGFIAGLILVWPLRRPEYVYHADQYWPW